MQRLGASSGRVTPVPIPNTEVKPLSADDTLLGKVGQRPDSAFKSKNHPLGWFFRCLNYSKSFK